MSNNINGIFNTLVLPAATGCMMTAKFENVMLESVFTDLEPGVGTVGQTLNINIPKVNEADVVNIGSGPIQVSDTDHTPQALVIDTKWSDAKPIQSFDQIRSPLALQQLYLEPMIESVLRKANRDLANLMNPAASTGILTTNAAVTGATANSFIRTDIASSWNKLRANGAPDNPADQFFITNNTPFSNMMSDTSTANWATQYVVGTDAATALQQQARFAPQFNTVIRYDQTAPKNASSKYLGLHFHRYAIGLKCLYETSPDTGGYVRETFVTPRPGVPVRIQLWYDPNRQAFILHASLVYGKSVVRPEFAVQVVAG